MANRSETALDTLAMLYERLNKVDYVLNGATEGSAQHEASQTSGSASARLRTLERTLQSLVARSPAAADTLALQKAHPALFSGDTSAETTPTLSTASLAGLVLAHSQLYSSVSSQLAHLQDISIPDPAAATQLVDLQPRINRAIARQEQQAREMAELRARSARVVEKWYERGVLEMGERWADWEERLRDAEILVRRKEAVSKREQGVV